MSQEIQRLVLYLRTSIPSSEVRLFLALALGALVRLILQLQVDLILQAQLAVGSIGTRQKIDLTRLHKIVG